MKPPRIPPVPDQNIIETRNLCKSFGGILAVNDLNLTVKRNTIHALIGPNGAGKTTVFNLLTKFLTPTSGQILFDDVDITYVSPAALARKGIVRSFQISSTFHSLTVLENVRVALQQRLGNALHFWRSKASLYTLHDHALELIDWVGLSADINTKADSLSYGKKRALEIATTLALEPEMLLLDEPMAGLGQEDIGRIAELIKRISENRTVLMVEHNLSVVEDLCDRITVLARGAILAEGDYATVSKDSAVLEAYIGGGEA
ncbi:ABC transporter ATP-binding protein [Martelella sp. AMO21009]